MRALAVLTLALPAWCMPPRLLLTSADGDEGFSLSLSLSSLRDPASIIACVEDETSTRSRALAAIHIDVRQPTRALIECFEGASYALLLPPLSQEREHVGIQLINASLVARDAGRPGLHLSGVFLLSVIGAEREHVPASMRAYATLERRLADAWGPAPGALVLRTAFYQQNLLLWARDARHEHALRLPLSESGCFAPLSSSDVAAVVAQLAISDEAPVSVAFRDAGVAVLRGGGSPALELAGPAWLNGSSLATLATVSTGTKLSFEAVGADDAVGMLHMTGLDLSEAQLLVDLLTVQVRYV